MGLILDLWPTAARTCLVRRGWLDNTAVRARRPAATGSLCSSPSPYHASTVAAASSGRRVPVVSRIKASAPGSAAPRPGRHRARRAPRISRKRLPMLAEIPFSINCLYRRSARVLRACGQEHLERGVGEHDRPHVAAVGDQARRLAERPLPVEERRADARDGRRPATRRRCTPRVRIASVASSPSSQISPAVEAHIEAAATSARRALVVERQTPVQSRRAPPAGRARRCRDSGSRAPGRPPAAIVPLPDAAGPSTAMTGTRVIAAHAETRRANSAKYPGNVLRTQSGSLIRTGAPPSAASEKHIAIRWSS